MTGTTSTTVTLKWDPSTDNVGVAGYNIYFGNTKMKTTTDTTATVTELLSDQKYMFIVTAFDEAGNESDVSEYIEATTLEDSFELKTYVLGEQASYGDRVFTVDSISEKNEDNEIIITGTTNFDGIGFIFEIHSDSPHQRLVAPRIFESENEFYEFTAILRSYRTINPEYILVKMLDSDYNDVVVAKYTLDAELSSISINDRELNGFVCGKNNYTCILPPETFEPEIDVVTYHPDATVEITQDSSLPRTATIEVTAPDGQTKKTYTVDMYPPQYADLRLNYTYGETGTGASGNFSRKYTDMTALAPGFELVFSRTYNSTDNRIGPMGRGWTFGFESSIVDS
ncbi:DUF6531 domain-containing protein, partial [Herbivorax sp. ANBcel31]|uniref:DUF6531 domain-containing protein n=1 Tax=Herbivorax sp. ANBcel31 TaxID=3069754 RepID=UPI0027B55F13